MLSVRVVVHTAHASGTRVRERPNLLVEEDGGAKGICTVAGLMRCLAYRFQHRLPDEQETRTIVRLDMVSGAMHPRKILKVAWRPTLEKDYTPVFRHTLAVFGALCDSKPIDDATRKVVECANRVADSLSKFCDDHAGPLYHRILGSRRATGSSTPTTCWPSRSHRSLDVRFDRLNRQGHFESLRNIDPV